MANSLKQFIERMNQEGREKFARITSDQDRTVATASNAALMGAFIASIVTALYVALYISLTAIFIPDALREPAFWFQLLYVCLFLGAVQGGAAGAVLGWGQGLLWQGKRRKAGTICAAGAGALIALLFLFEFRFYSTEIPLHLFLFWAFVLFGPGYLAASSVLAWGISLLSEG